MIALVTPGCGKNLALGQFLLMCAVVALVGPILGGGSGGWPGGQGWVLLVASAAVAGVLIGALVVLVASSGWLDRLDWERLRRCERSPMR